MTKKIVSLLVATLVALSLCSTAFAAISPSEIGKVYVADVTAEGLQDDEKVVVTYNYISESSCTEDEYEASKELINNQDKVIEALEDNGVDVPADAEMILLGGGEYKAYLEHYGEDWSDYYREDYNGPMSLTLSLGYLDMDVEDGTTVYVLHYTDNGTWEVFECVVENHKITLNLDSLSPILIYKMMSDGTINTVEPDLTDTVEEVTEETVEETVEVTTTTTENTVSSVSTMKKSPYTGA